MKLALLATILLCASLKAQKHNENFISRSNYSKSTLSMFQLLQLESLLLNNFHRYVKRLERKLTLIRTGLAQMHAFNLEAHKSAEMQLSNPWRSLALMRHMALDWPQWHALMQRQEGAKQIKSMRAHFNYLPQAHDLTDAALGLLHVQSVYNLTTDDIVKGLLDGKQYDASLNGLDCFEIGMALYEQEYYADAYDWFENALDYFKRHNLTSNAYFKNIYRFKVATLWNQNLRLEGLRALSEAITLTDYDSHFEKQKALLTVNSIRIGPRKSNLLELKPDENDLACAVKTQPVKRLHCRYNNTNNAFLKLAPIKMEELNLSPYLVLFHEVLYDTEIDSLKAFAALQLRHSENLNLHNADEALRVPIDGSNITKSIQQRISDMTRFQMDNTEAMEILNYGIGGHYKAHSAATQEAERKRPIATLLFYMSDVPQGGATLFPQLSSMVYPKKGNAVLLYNLNKAGRPEEQALFAACPVIVGSKWVFKVMIDADSQMFVEPCWREA